MEFSGRTWRPPYERDTPIIEATTGCAWGRCSFCNLFAEERFSVGSLERFERELDEVKACIPNTRRLWLTGGSPFQMSFEQLEARANAVRDRLIKCQSIAMFASVRDIARKTDGELRRLRALQVNGLTIGVESGNDEALALAHKGYTAHDVIEQLTRLDRAGIEYNVTYMTGLLGAGRGRWHAHTTAEVLNRLNPKIIAVSSLTAFPGTKLHEKVRSGSFAMPDEAERLEELKAFLGEIQLRVHLEASSKSNAVPVMGMLPLDKALIIAKLEAAIEEERRANPNRNFRGELSSLGWDEERSEDLSSKSARAELACASLQGPQRDNNQPTLKALPLER